ncbi:MAG: type II/IV secretion system protein [Sedimentisphaerales bacterium]|nr:type II/IV secretion system protein [Sedimentisphaerales bacterium]
MKNLDTFLIQKNILTPDEFEAVNASEPSEKLPSATAEPIYYRLLRHHPELENKLWKSLAEFLQVELVDPHQLHLEPGLAKILPARIAHEHSIVPLSLKGNQLEIALADPRQFEKCQELAMLLEDNRDIPNRLQQPFTIVGRLGQPSDIALMIKSLYGIGADTVQDILDESGTQKEVMILAPEIVDLSRDESSDEDAAIIRFVNQLLLEAVKMGASDIHLEPFEKDMRIRFRVDGILRREPVPEKLKHLEAAIISRIKIMAHMDIAEKRLPQDGQIRLQVVGRPVDVRVSVLPTMFGQGLALRLLDKQVAFRKLGHLGLSDDYMRLYKHILTLSHGVILVTGPTGSGKTTTLYASLNEINNQICKIITIEDPIEYQLEGITQIQVKPQIGLDFANMLRSILRHDPDVIMVGEIRDRSTAQIAISAAMTGHLVFSTLHTNDAPSAPIRLLEMGLEPYLVSSALEAVIAQRLVRLLCTHCRKPAESTDFLPWDDLEALGQGTVYKSNGCPSCSMTGFKGRTAIFEMFTLNDTIRQIILNHGNTEQIRSAALAIGMKTLQQSGLEKVNHGLTSLAEVYRVARDETIDMQTEMNK